MRALIQKVRKAWVEVDNRRISEIDKGFLILVGIKKGDAIDKAKKLAKRCCHLRIFEDGDGKMNHSLMDIGGQALVVSQFTLVADTKKGNRPSFINAETPDKADSIYKEFIDEISKLGIETKSGIFGARMIIGIENDGPVTIILEV